MRLDNDATVKCVHIDAGAIHAIRCLGALRFSYNGKYEDRTDQYQAKDSARICHGHARQNKTLSYITHVRACASVESPQV